MIIKCQSVKLGRKTQKTNFMEYTNNVYEYSI